MNGNSPELATPKTPTILKTWTIIDIFFSIAEQFKEAFSLSSSLSPFLLKNRCEDFIDFHIKGLVKLTVESRIDMSLETHILRSICHPDKLTTAIVYTNLFESFNSDNASNCQI